MPHAVKADYDSFAQAFSDTRQKPWGEVSDFLETLQKKSLVLDIGCGNGRHLIEAKKRGLNAVGLDISRNLLKIAKRKAKVSLILGNALALPFKNGAFGNSICIAVVHHLKAEKDRLTCLKEIARTTKNIILASVWAFEQEKFAKRKSPDIQLGWNKESSRFANASLEAFEDFGIKGSQKLDTKCHDSKPSKHPRFYHLFRNGELELLAKTAGLSIDKSWREGNNYWAILGINPRRKTII